MADSPVNIADFRCRGTKIRFSEKAVRASRSSLALALVEPEGEYEYDVHESAEESPDVLDISRGRESQRVHTRIVLRAVPPRNRSNVIRFNEPRVAVMRLNEARVEHWTSDDYDQPPAA